MSDIKMSDVFYRELGQVPHNPSFEIQDLIFCSYGEQRVTTSEQDSAVELAVLSYDSNQKRIEELEGALSAALKYIAECPCDPDIYDDQLSAWNNLWNLNPKELLEKPNANN